MITVNAYSDAFVFWMTDSVFIDEAIVRVGTSGYGMMLSTPVSGADCDPSWSWHPDPASGSFINSAPFNPACIGSPTDVENALAQYQAANAGWCPMQVFVVSVSDQR